MGERNTSLEVNTYLTDSDSSFWRCGYLTVLLIHQSVYPYIHNTIRLNPEGICQRRGRDMGGEGMWEGKDTGGKRCRMEEVHDGRGT